MKQYFNNYKSKLPEYVQMKRIAIKKMRNDKATYKQIAEVIGISPQAVSRLHKKQGSINSDIERDFHRTIALRLYPMFEKKRIVWKQV
jgi:plasmid maintenance system antidote protein VapI